jgi:predicted AAA+ superfamily ATPase
MVGGMPEAVRRYAETKGDLAAVNHVYADLFTAFRDDIPKYGRNETMRRVLLHGLDSAPYAAGTRVTFNGFGGSTYRSREMGEALRTLERAMLLELVYPTVNGQEPFVPDHKKSPRLHFLDVGLVNHRAGLQRELIGVRDLTGLHRGHLIEQVVGQELKSTDARTDVPLVFWVRDKAQAQAEVDFLLRTERGVVPVEVKSGAAGKLRSLHQFMGRSGSRLAVRLCASQPSRHSVDVGDLSYLLVNIPYYAASMIPQYVAVEG